MNEEKWLSFYLVTGYGNANKTERMINIHLRGLYSEPFLSTSYSPSHNFTYIAFATNGSSTMEYEFVLNFKVAGNVTGSDYVYHKLV